jgi:rod shape-determining protein MreB
LNEPSIIAIDTYTQNVEATGVSAKALLGRTPENIKVIKPMEEGVIADIDAVEKMLKEYITHIAGN